MDNSYLMAKLGLESKDLLQSNKRGCCYYLKYFFLFTSIIQFLILLGLVLFMIYGNAHISTELRLKNVENHNQKLLMNIQELKDSLRAESSKVSSCNGRYYLMQEELDNMNQTLQTMHLENFKQSKIIVHLQSAGRACQCSLVDLNNLTSSYYAEKEKKTALESEFRNYKENCAKNMGQIKSQVHQANYVRDECQIEVSDYREKVFTLQSQMELLKGSCTSIEEKFKAMLQSMKESFETVVVKFVPANDFKQNQICKFLNDGAMKIIESYLSRLGHEISMRQQLNSELQMSKNRSENALEQCLQEQTRLLEKNKLDHDTIQRNYDAKLKAVYVDNNKLRMEIDQLVTLKKSTLTYPDFNDNRVGEQGGRAETLHKVIGLSV